MFTGPHDHRRLVVRDLGPQRPGLLRRIRRLPRHLLGRRPGEAAGFAAGHRRLRLRLPAAPAPPAVRLRLRHSLRRRRGACERSGSDALTDSATAGSGPGVPGASGVPATRLSTKPCPGTTPPRRSDSGSAWTGLAAPPIASRSNVPGTIRSTQVRACSPDISRVAPPSVIVHHTAPRRNMITPSRIGATIPNAGASPDMWPMTQAARRLAIALADASRSEPTSAASPSSSPITPAAAGLTPASSRGITMTVSPNRPTRPGPGSMPIRVVSCSIVLPLRPGATWAFCHAAEQAETAAEYPGRLRW